MHKKGIPSLIALLLHGVGFLVYLYLLYSGFWVALYLKCCIYFFISAMFLFLIIDEWDGVDNHKQWQFNTVNKFTFIFNFISASLTALEIIDMVSAMMLYSCAIIITSSFILHSGLRHGYFKNE